MEEKYRFLERPLFEKATQLILEMLKDAKEPFTEKLIANLVVEAWNISYFPEKGRESEIEEIKRWYKQQGYLEQQQTEEILRKAIKRKWEITKGMEWEGLWTRIENFQRRRLKDGKIAFEFELEFWE